MITITNLHVFLLPTQSEDNPYYSKPGSDSSQTPQDETTRVDRYFLQLHSSRITLGDTINMLGWLHS